MKKKGDKKRDKIESHSLIIMLFPSAEESINRAQFTQFCPFSHPKIFGAITSRPHRPSLSTISLLLSTVSFGSVPDRHL